MPAANNGELLQIEAAPFPKAPAPECSCSMRLPLASPEHTSEQYPSSRCLGPLLPDRPDRDQALQRRSRRPRQLPGGHLRRPTTATTRLSHQVSPRGSSPELLSHLELIELACYAGWYHRLTLTGLCGLCYHLANDSSIQAKLLVLLFWRVERSAAASACIGRNIRPSKHRATARCFFVFS